MSAWPLRGGWKFWARLLVSGALLVILLSRINPNELLPPVRDTSHLAFLGLAVLTTFLGIVASSWRWQRVLIAFGVRPSLPSLTRYYLAGQFVGNVLPSTIGGDVIRISRCGRTIDSNETAFASVALERLTGFVALPLISIVGFAFTPSIMAWRRSWLALAIGAATLVALVVILYLAAHPRAAGRFAERENWTRFVGAIHTGVTRLRHRPGVVVGILTTAIVYQITVVISVALAARALDVSVPTAALFAFVPVIAIAQVIPITVGGLGIREGLLVLFLGPFGVSETQAVALGLLWYGMILVVSLLGAPAFAAGHDRNQDAVIPRSGE
jgi:glycosyltransferase 2 family protein